MDGVDEGYSLSEGARVGTTVGLLGLWDGEWLGP